jgi:ABC-type phosphate/phosphonate transport system substrate-binding protein
MLFTGTARVTRGDVNTNGDALEEAILAASNLTVRVQFAASGADAVAALCGSAASPVAVAWVDGVTYAAAQSQGCGEPWLLVEREVGGEVSPGAQVNIIVNTRAGINGIAELSGATFCRLGVSDLYTWIVPSFMMAASRVAPVSLGAIEDVDTLGALVDAVADGDCDAAGISTADLEDVGAPNTVRALTQPVVVPYAILVMPPAAPLGLREAVTSAISAIAGDPERADVLGALLNQTRVLAVEDDTLNGWDAFVRSTRLNFATMGQ